MGFDIRRSKMKFVLLLIRFYFILSFCSCIGGDSTASNSGGEGSSSEVQGMCEVEGTIRAIYKGSQEYLEAMQESCGEFSSEAQAEWSTTITSSCGQNMGCRIEDSTGLGDACLCYTAASTTESDVRNNCYDGEIVSSCEL